MQKRYFLHTIAAAAMLTASLGAQAQEKFKIGLILPMTGAFASTG